MVRPAWPSALAVRLGLLARQTAAASAQKRALFHTETSVAMGELFERVSASFQTQGLMGTLGATLAHVVDGEVHIALPFSLHLSQQHGYLHAGAVTAIVDSACGYAALTRAPAGFDVVTAEFKLNLMRPAVGQRFVAVGQLLNAGRTLSVCTGEVRAYADASDAYKIVAIMQATMVAVQR